MERTQRSISLSIFVCFKTLIAKTHGGRRGVRSYSAAPPSGSQSQLRRVRSGVGVRAREPDSDPEGFYEGFQVGLTRNRGGRPGWEHSISNALGCVFLFL